MNYQQQMSEHGFAAMNGQSPAFFPVSIQPVMVNDVPVPGYRAIQRDDTQDILAIHSDGYKLTPYAEKAELLESAICESSLDTTDMQVMYDTSHNGAKLFCGYTFPAHKVEITNGDEVSLRIAYWDSYDGSCSMIIRAGAYCFACANLSLSGKDVVNIRRKHTKNNDLEGILETVMGTLNAYLQDTEDFKEWTQIPVNSAKVITLTNAVPNSTKAWQDAILKSWILATDHTGEGSLWDLYNVFTAWSTHGTDKTKATVDAQATRMIRVANIRSSRHWSELAVAA